MQSREKCRRLVVGNCGERSECVRRSLDGAWWCRRSTCMRLYAGECVSFEFRQSGVGACMHACKLPGSRVGTYRKDAVDLLDPPECEL